MTVPNEPAMLKGDREIAIVRVFDAPREDHADEGLGRTMARLGEYVNSMKGRA